MLSIFLLLFYTFSFYFPKKKFEVDGNTWKIMESLVHWNFGQFHLCPLVKFLSRRGRPPDWNSPPAPPTIFVIMWGTGRPGKWSGHRLFTLDWVLEKIWNTFISIFYIFLANWKDPYILFFSFFRLVGHTYSGTLRLIWLRENVVLLLFWGRFALKMPAMLAFQIKWWFVCTARKWRWKNMTSAYTIY